MGGFDGVKFVTETVTLTCEQPKGWGVRAKEPTTELALERVLLALDMETEARCSGEAPRSAASQSSMELKEMFLPSGIPTSSTALRRRWKATYFDEPVRDFSLLTKKASEDVSDRAMVQLLISLTFSLLEPRLVIRLGKSSRTHFAIQVGVSCTKEADVFDKVFGPKVALSLTSSSVTSDKASDTISSHKVFFAVKALRLWKACFGPTAGADFCMEEER
jgi:hypothetical protein